jgi:hypothetical protein
MKVLEGFKGGSGPDKPGLDPSDRVAMAVERVLESSGRGLR